MTLYEMLAKARYDQVVWVYEINAFDQNMPVFKGLVNDARTDTDDVWPLLMAAVEDFQCSAGILVIRTRNERYEKHLEEHYHGSKKWGENIEDRPWRYSCEIDEELKRMDARRLPSMQEDGVLIVPANGDVFTRTQKIMLDPGPGYQFCRYFICEKK